MNLHTKFTPGNTFNSSGSKFTILLRKDNLLLSEQRINGKLVAYEITAVAIRPERIFRDGKWITTGDTVEQYPGAEAFGKGKYDWSFNSAEKDTAIGYFDLCVKGIIKTSRDLKFQKIKDLIKSEGL